MAESTVRKSSRIKTKKRSYLEDFEYDEAAFDISTNISEILESHSLEQTKGKPHRRESASFPHVLGKLSKKNNEDNMMSCPPALAEDNLDSLVSTSGNEDSPSSIDPTLLLNTENMSCPLCGKHLAEERELEAHMLEHQNHRSGIGSSENAYVCDICHRTFGDTAMLNRHMKTHTGDRPFKCQQCDKSFAESCSLKRHEKTHFDDRPFTCDLCFKSFRDSAGFVRHQKTHTDRPRIFQCLKCEKSFTDKCGLKRHERIHTGLRPYECKVCFKTFSESGSFRRHQKIHTGVRNFQCPRCKRSFLEKQSLVRHQKNVCGFGAGQVPENSESNQEDSLSWLDESNDGSRSSLHGQQSEEDVGIRKDGVAGIKTDDLSSESNQLFSSSFKAPVEKTKNIHSERSLNGDKKLNEKDKVGSKDSPSLSSLMKKDPNLCDSISEIVDSIDSYEKMLDLCGDSGQRQIEAALTRDPIPWPDNLLCFECGEPLVDGENFKSEGKTYHPSLQNSMKCQSCEEEEDDYGEPPVLTAELPLENMDAQGREMERNGVSVEEASAYSAQETMKSFQERLKAQHGVYFVGPGYREEEEDDEDEDDEEEEEDSRSPSDELSSELLSVSAKTSSHEEGNQNPQAFLEQNSNGSPEENKEMNITQKPVDQLEHGSTSSFSNVLASSIKQPLPWTSPSSQWPAVPKLEYEADDPNIPSVFPCHLCTKVFATSAFLEQHIDLHRKSPHKCMVCSKSFTNSPSLKRHMRTHTGEKPYSCPTCHKQFRDPSNFCKHKKVCAAASSIFPTPTDSPSSSSTVSGEEPALRKKRGRPKKDKSAQLLKLSAKNSKTDDLPISFSYDQGYDASIDDVPITFSYDLDVKNSEVSHGSSQNIEALQSMIKTEYDVKQEADMMKEEEGLQLCCEICERKYNNTQDLENHMRYHLSMDPDVTCEECGKSFADIHNLKRHRRIHAGIRPFGCDYCGRGYCDNWSLKKHKSRGCVSAELKVPADFLYPCSQCTRIFSETDLLQEHLKTHKGLLRYECDICGKGFSEAFNLKRHRRLHMAICQGCEREFKDVPSLTEHQQTECPASLPESAANGENSFPCPECGRVYSSKAYLERHKKFHSELKPHVCEVCGKRFTEAFKLRRHMRTHVGGKPHLCPECGKGFGDEASLKRHCLNNSCVIMKLASGPGEFACQLCDKVFNKNYLLARHMNVHSQERPFVCNVCGRAYKDTSSLRRHQLIHQGVKDFVCSECGKDFFYADSLRRHVAGKCGKKPKRRRRGHVRRNNKVTNSYSNNNNNNEYPGAQPARKKRKMTTSVYTPSKLPCIPASFSDSHPLQKVKVSTWSCHARHHCWRCDLLLTSASELLRHARIHQHVKRFRCSRCFLRLACKSYWKAHMASHDKHKPVLRSQLKANQASLVEPVVEKTPTGRPKRSIPRAQWSWISQI